MKKLLLFVSFLPLFYAYPLLNPAYFAQDSANALPQLIHEALQQRNLLSARLQLDRLPKNSLPELYYRLMYFLTMEQTERAVMVFNQLQSLQIRHPAQRFASQALQIGRMRRSLIANEARTFLTQYADFLADNPDTDFLEFLRSSVQQTLDSPRSRLSARDKNSIIQALDNRPSPLLPVTLQSDVSALDEDIQQIAELKILGLFEQARTKVESFRANQPLHPEAFFLHADILLIFGDYQAASVLLTNYASQFSTLPKFELLSLRILFQTHPQEALQAVEMLVSQASDYEYLMQSKLLWSRFLLAQTRAGESLEILSQLEQFVTTEQELEYRSLLAQCHTALQMYSKAYQILKDAHRKFPNSREILVQLISNCILRGKRDMAAKIAHKLLHTNPSKKNLALLQELLPEALTSLKLRQRDWLKDINAADKLLPWFSVYHYSLHPQAENPYLILGILYTYNCTDAWLELAEKLLAQGLFLPEVAAQIETVYASYGQTEPSKRITGDDYAQFIQKLQSLGQHDLLCAWLEFVLAYTDLSLGLKLLIVPSLIQERKLVLASTILQEALRQDVDVIKTLTDLAYIEYLNGNPQQATSLFQEILRLEPDNTSVLFQMAEVYRSVGSRDEAEAIYARLSQHPTDSQVRQDANYFLRSLKGANP